MTKTQQLLADWKANAAWCRAKAKEDADIGYKIDMNRMAAEYEDRVKQLEKALE
jgi:hypothetical protein